MCLFFCSTSYSYMQLSVHHNNASSSDMCSLHAEYECEHWWFQQQEENTCSTIFRTSVMAMTLMFFLVFGTRKLYLAIVQLMSCVHFLYSLFFIKSQNGNGLTVPFHRAFILYPRWHTSIFTRTRVSHIMQLYVQR